MNTDIIVPIISGFFTVVCVLLSNYNARKKQSAEFEVKANTKLELIDAKFATIEEKFDTLTAEVREHNNFARRLPVVESEIQHINKEIDELKRKE